MSRPFEVEIRPRPRFSAAPLAQLERPVYFAGKVASREPVPVGLDAAGRVVEWDSESELVYLGRGQRAGSSGGVLVDLRPALLRNVQISGAVTAGQLAYALDAERYMASPTMASPVGVFTGHDAEDGVAHLVTFAHSEARAMQALRRIGAL